jgi:ABC-type branched-subunit amino acid transport system ATPase component
VIEIDGLEVRFGGVSAISGLSVVLDSPVTGLIGPNGAGKTTLLNVLSGFITPTKGTVKVDGQDLARIQTHRRAAFGIRRTFQTEQVVLNLSIWDNVAGVLDHISSTPSGRRSAMSACTIATI